MQIPFVKIDDTAIIPRKASNGAAAFDLFVPRETAVTLGNVQSGPLANRVLVGTKITVAIPPGFVGMVCPRSGLAFKHGITVANAPGIIDSDYRGELGVILINHGPEIVTFGGGDRIAQLLILENPYTSFVERKWLDSTPRGDGGFGSTGR